MSTRSYTLWTQLHAKNPMLLRALIERNPKDAWPEEFSVAQSPSPKAFQFHAQQSWEQLLEDVYPVLSQSEPLLDALFGTNDFFVYLMGTHQDPLQIQIDAFLLPDQSVFGLFNVPKLHLPYLIRSFLQARGQGSLFDESLEAELYSSLNSDPVFWRQHFGTNAAQILWKNIPIYFEKTQHFFDGMQTLLHSYIQNDIWSRLTCTCSVQEIQSQLKTFARYQDMSLQALQKRIEQLRLSTQTITPSTLLQSPCDNACLQSLSHQPEPMEDCVPSTHVTSHAQPSFEVAPSSTLDLVPQKLDTVQHTQINAQPKDDICKPTKVGLQKTKKSKDVDTNNRDIAPDVPVLIVPTDHSLFTVAPTEQPQEDIHFLDSSQWSQIPELIELSDSTTFSESIQISSNQVVEASELTPSEDLTHQNDQKSQRMDPVESDVIKSKVKQRAFTAKAPSTVIVPPEPPNNFLPQSQAAMERPPIRGRLGKVGIHAQSSFQKKHPK